METDKHLAALVEKINAVSNPAVEALLRAEQMGALFNLAGGLVAACVCALSLRVWRRLARRLAEDDFESFNEENILIAKLIGASFVVLLSGCLAGAALTNPWNYIAPFDLVTALARSILK